MAVRPPNVKGLFVAVVLLLLVAVPPKIGVGFGEAVVKLNAFDGVAAADVAAFPALKLKLLAGAGAVVFVPSPVPPKLNTLLLLLGSVNGVDFAAGLLLPPNENMGAAAGVTCAVVVPPVADVFAESAAVVGVPKLKTGVGAAAAVVVVPKIGVATGTAVTFALLADTFAAPKPKIFCGSDTMLFVIVGTGAIDVVVDVGA